MNNKPALKTKQKTTKKPPENKSPMRIPPEKVLEGALLKIGKITMEIDVYRSMLAALENENKQLKEQLAKKKK